MPGDAADEGLNEPSAEARAAVRRFDDERRELSTSTPVDPDLHRPHDPVAIDGDDEPAPIEVARVEVRLTDEARDGRLISGGGWSDDRAAIGRHAAQLSPAYFV